MTVASNIHVGLPGWSNATYAVGARRSNAGQAYQVITAGTSTVPPSGTAADIAPGGTAHWKWLSAVDYRTLQSWADAIPGTLSQPVVGLLWNDGIITATLGTTLLSLSGHATTPTNTITLKPAAGEGFKDRPPTTPFYYNATNGCSIQCPATGYGGVNYISISDSNVILESLQFADPNSASNSSIIGGSGQNLTIRKCIIDGYSQPGGATIIAVPANGLTLVNNLLIERGSSADPAVHCVGASGCYVVNNTFIATSSVSGRRLLDCGTNTVEGTNFAVNNIYVNYDAVYAATFGNVWSSNHNAYTAASLSSSNNGTDSGGSLYGIATASVFVNSASDFHLKPGSPCIAAGVANSLSPDDAFGTIRPQSTPVSIYEGGFSPEYGGGGSSGVPPDIGAHELLSVSMVFRDFVVPVASSRGHIVSQSISLARTLSLSAFSVSASDWGGSASSTSMSQRMSLEIKASFLTYPDSLVSQFSSDFSSDFGPILNSSNPSFAIEFAQRRALPTRDATVALEWSASRLSDKRTPKSQSATVASSAIYPNSFSATLPVLAGLGSDVYSADFALSFGVGPYFLDPAFTLELGKTGSADTAISDSFSSYIPMDSIIPAEWLGKTSFSVSSTIPISWGVHVDTRAGVPFAWGVPFVLRDLVGSMDWRGTASSDTASSIEPSSNKLAEAKLATHIDAQTSNTTRLEEENLSSRARASRSTLQNNASAITDQQSGTESLAFASTSVVFSMTSGLYKAAYLVVQPAWFGLPFADMSGIVSVDSGISWDKPVSYITDSCLYMFGSFDAGGQTTIWTTTRTPSEWDHLLLPVSVDLAYLMEVLSVSQSDIIAELPIRLGRKAIGSRLTPDEWEGENEDDAES